MERIKAKSFKYALSGIWTALKEEPNLKFHFFASLMVLVLGFLFQISKIDWIALFFAIGLVISLELINTAIEEIVDSLTQIEHPGAKRAKDVAAGAVLIASITALAVGAFIFVPYLIKF